MPAALPWIPAFAVCELSDLHDTGEYQVGKVMDGCTPAGSLKRGSAGFLDFFVDHFFIGH